MVRKTVGYVELEWTCPNCNSRNPGPNKYCNGCGAPQPEDVEFEQPAEEKLLKDQEAIARAQAGPDVHCPYCRTRNRGDAKFCGSCGGDLSSAIKRARGRVLGEHRDKPAPKVKCPACHAENAASALNCTQCGASLADTRIPAAAPRAARQPGRPIPKVAVIGLLVLCVGLAFVLFGVFTRTEELTGQVRSVQWTRTIPILALGEVESEAWLEDIPSDASIGACRMEYHRSQDQPAPNSEEVCGTPYTVDKGSGYGEVVQDCVYEVYEEKCTYTTMEWLVVDEVTATGTDMNPFWPQVTMMQGQQQGEGEEQYEIVFMADDEAYSYSTTDSTEFTQFTPGSIWQLEVSSFDTVVSVEPMP